MRLDAVSGAARNALNSAYTRHQVSYSNVCPVRDEEAAGSNPATPTQVRAHMTLNYEPPPSATVSGPPRPVNPPPETPLVRLAPARPVTVREGQWLFRQSLFRDDVW